MSETPKMEMSYFPGCSLVSTARENNLSLIEFCRKIGVNLIELEDWNCCGTSSAHKISSQLALDLCARNLSLCPPGRPLLVACPSCLLQLRVAKMELRSNESLRKLYENKWGRAINTDLQLLFFLELCHLRTDLHRGTRDRSSRLNGLRVVCYYGCMLARPPKLLHQRKIHGLMEKILSSMGAVSLFWPYTRRCCGTFLSAARPEIVTAMVDKIMSGAINAGAECIVTACAMCHLNLEARNTFKNPVPILHFSEILSLAMGADSCKHWFSRHLIDPQPILKARELIR